MTTVISVRFQNGQKSYYFDPQTLEVEPGRDVIVETAQGLEYAFCCEGNHEIEDTELVAPLRPVIRLATDNDRHTVAYNHTREAEAFDICLKKIAAHELDMKLVSVECSFDGTKILFFFTADGRVDFRDLVKDLASVFRSRIELRQIGVRDEAKMIGGLGICGRPFCCSQFMDEFIPVSIKMAKTQNLSLNPAKISGTCGRLMCCLKYEQDAYEDALKRLPKNESFVLTPDGIGNVSEVNLLKETVKVVLDETPESPQYYRNSEIIVLRNGKGNRDGIIIPKDRPARYVAPAKEEYIPPIVTDYTSFDTSFEISEPAPAEPRRSRSRNRAKKREEITEVPAAPMIVEAEPEKEVPVNPKKQNGRRRPQERNAAKKAAVVEAKKTPEPKTPVAVEPAHIDADDAPKKNMGNRRRHRGHGGKKPASGEIRTATPIVSEVVKEPATTAKPSGEGKKPSHRRYRHRPHGKKPSTPAGE